MRPTDKRILLSIALVVASFAGSARAATTQGAEPEIAPLVAEALERNPELAAARERAEAASRIVPQVGALPDPMLNVNYENDGWRPTLGEMQMTRLSFMASQALPFPGKRGLRTDIAGRAAEEIAYAIDRRRLGIEADVVRAYADLLLARKVLGVIDEQERIWTETSEIAKARYSVGEGAQQDLLRVQVEVTRAGALRAAAKADESVALAALNRLRDEPPDAPVETNGPLTPAGASAPVLEELLAKAYEESPEVRAADSAIRRAEKQVGLARLDFYPDFAVSAGYMNRGGLDPMWQAGFSLNVPIWTGRKQSNALGEAEASLRGARQDAAAARLLLRERSQERIALLTAALRTAEIFEKGILPQDETSVEAALANYRVGQVPFVTVLEALSALYNDRTEHLNVMAKTRKARASLEELDLSGGPAMGAAGFAPPAMSSTRSSPSASRAGM